MQNSLKYGFLNAYFQKYTILHAERALLTGVGKNFFEKIQNL